MKVIIAGGRDFNDYELLKKNSNYFLGHTDTRIEIVSGGQVSINKKTGERHGADYLGERFAKENGYAVKKFPANWSKYGKSAGPIRNKEMAEYADMLIAFWDGKSKGTKNMIDLAIQYELKVYVVNFS